MNPAGKILRIKWVCYVHQNATGWLNINLLKHRLEKYIKYLKLKKQRC